MAKRRRSRKGSRTEASPGYQSLPEDLQELAASRWQDLSAACQAAKLRLPRDRHWIASCQKVLACSEFVADNLINEPHWLAQLIYSGDLHSDYQPGSYMQRALSYAAPLKNKDELARMLRLFRRYECVRIAWRDLAGWADLNETLHDLSLLADACIAAAMVRLEVWQAKEWGQPKTANGKSQSMIVMAMGKLGAYELNFSSDIDLIFAYAEDGKLRGRNGLEYEEYYARLGQQLIDVIDSETEDGFVYRVDMRLRPYGRSGALASGFEALEDYYQTQGRDWERYAWIKARPVWGREDHRQQIMQLMQPFVYRRYLDFEAFAALRDMKAQINREVSRRGMQDNVKLGPGGIREIEFIGQAFQLIRGGREPALRIRDIQSVLGLLAQAGYIETGITDQLINDYRVLRKVENALQMAADRQVHSISNDHMARQQLACASGFSDWDELATRLDAVRSRVHNSFNELITAPEDENQTIEIPDPGGLVGVWIPDLPEQEILQRLTDAGFESPASAWQGLQDFRNGYAYRTMGQQGRERMNRLMPLILGALYSVEDMDTTLMRVIHLLERIAGRTTYLSLLIENPLALVQLVRLLGASAWIAELLALHPALLDELYDPVHRRLQTDREHLVQQISARMGYVDEDDLEQQMEALHHFKDAVVLGIADASITEGMLSDEVGRQLAICADVCLDQALALNCDYLLKRHGMPCGNQWPGFAVIAYGKLGGQELNYSSDLDLVFLHGCEREGTVTRGPKKIPSETFLARLGQRFIHMLNQPTATGTLYEVDMRLRPSGNSGLLVQSLAGFQEYQLQEAWVWEHQALVKARAVAGDTDICERFERIRHEILCQPRDPLSLRNEVVSMRKRMRNELLKHRPGKFDLKQGNGGLVDIEFMVQYAVLRCAERYPELTGCTDNIGLLDLLDESGLIESAIANGLTDAYRYYLQRIQSLTLDGLRMQVDAEQDRSVREYVAGIWEHWFDLYLS